MRSDILLKVAELRLLKCFLRVAELRLRTRKKVARAHLWYVDVVVDINVEMEEHMTRTQKCFIEHEHGRGHDSLLQLRA